VLSQLLALVAHSPALQGITYVHSGCRPHPPTWAIWPIRQGGAASAGISPRASAAAGPSDTWLAPTSACDFRMVVSSALSLPRAPRSEPPSPDAFLCRGPPSHAPLRREVVGGRNPRIQGRCLLPHGGGDVERWSGL